MKLQRSCGFIKNTLILEDRNSSRQPYKNLTQILAFYKTRHSMHLKSSFHDWIFILYHLTHFRQKSQVSHASQKRTFKVLCHQPHQSLWVSCHRYKMFAFIHLSEVPMEFPHDQNQQWLGVLHQHLGTWVRNTYHFHSDYYLGNTKKNDSYHFEPWKGGNKQHIQLFKSFTDDSHQFRTFPEPVAFLK